MNVDDARPADRDEPPPGGGSGAESAPGLKADRLAARALAENWPIPEADRVRIIARLVALATDPTAKPRVVMSASRALMNAGNLNLTAVGTAIRACEFEQLTERLAALERMVAERGDIDT
jgi:hypothetical protein